MTLLFQSTFKSSLAILSYICRWASCRGALPQPLVVFVLAASAVSAPRRKKLMTIGLTLVLIRTVSEALHGYVNGNSDWEDEDDDKEDAYETESRHRKNAKENENENETDC